MIELKDLLLRFNTTLFSGEIKKEVIRKIISKNIKIEILSKDINIKNNIIYLNIKPIYKNEIYLNKEKIFSEIEGELGSRHPKSFL